MRLEEVKGFWRDDARKVKVTAKLFPFPLTVLRPKKGGGWNVESFTPLTGTEAV